jgi:hypothetical protein
MILQFDKLISEIKLHSDNDDRETMSSTRLKKENNMVLQYACYGTGCS